MYVSLISIYGYGTNKLTIIRWFPSSFCLTWAIKRSVYISKVM